MATNRVAASPQECVYFEEWVFAELTTLYSLALYRECRLSIIIFTSGQGRAAVNCVDRDGRVLHHVRELSTQEAGFFNQMILAATPFAGEYVGADLRAVDGAFTMLRVGLSKKTAVLVTIGNKSFDREGPRNELLRFLRGLEQRLLEQVQIPVRD